MNVHEYQAKAILKDYGVPVPRGHAAFAPEEAVAIAKELGGAVSVVKAQIHAGGRGKGHFKEPEAGEKGGVRIAKSLDDVRTFADQMLSHTLVTLQTGAAGRVVKRLLVEEGAAIARELYLSMLVDRASSRVAVIASTEGGMNIEDVAHNTPEKIFTMSIDPATGFSQFHGRQVAFALGLQGDQIKQCVKLIGNLYRAFTEKDMSLLEINPLIVTEKGDLVCLDAKLNFDGNALYRHADIMNMRDLDEEDPAEVLASRYDLSYVKLDGHIGCLVNGAGLAMATMDIIKLLWRGARELPRRGRRRVEREGDGGLQDHPLRPKCEGHPGEHFRRHHALRHHRGRHHRRRARDASQRAAGGPARRHQCRAGQGNPAQFGAPHHPRRRPWRSRAKDRCRGEEGRLTLHTVTQYDSLCDCVKVGDEEYNACG